MASLPSSLRHCLQEELRNVVIECMYVYTVASPHLMTAERRRCKILFKLCFVHKQQTQMCLLLDG